MIKPASLRAAIGAAFPTLKNDPDRLLVFVDNGHLVATSTATLSFEWRYTLNLILLDFADEPETLMIAVLAWVREQQIDLVQRLDERDGGITFEVDQLNGTTCDVSLKLSLTEGVAVSTHDDGTYSTAPAPEAVPGWWEI